MNKIINKIKTLEIIISVKEISPGIYLYCNNQILPDNTSVRILDKSGNMIQAFTRLQTNPLQVEFIDSVNLIPILDGIKILFRPFEYITITPTFEKDLTGLHPSFVNSSNGIITFAKISSDNKYFYDIKLATYIKNSFQDPEIGAYITNCLEFYLIMALNKLSDKHTHNVEYVDTKYIIYSGISLQK